MKLLFTLIIVALALAGCRGDRYSRLDTHVVPRQHNDVVVIQPAGEPLRIVPQQQPQSNLHFSSFRRR